MGLLDDELARRAQAARAEDARIGEAELKHAKLVESLEKHTPEFRATCAHLALPMRKLGFRRRGWTFLVSLESGEWSRANRSIIVWERAGWDEIDYTNGPKAIELAFNPRRAIDIDLGAIEGRVVSGMKRSIEAGSTGS